MIPRTLIIFWKRFLKKKVVHTYLIRVLFDYVLNHEELSDLLKDCITSYVLRCFTSV